MSPALAKTLITLAAGALTAISQVPGEPALLQLGLIALAGFFAGWAHLPQPGAPKGDQ